MIGSYVKVYITRIVVFKACKKCRNKKPGNLRVDSMVLL